MEDLIESIVQDVNQGSEPVPVEQRQPEQDAPIDIMNEPETPEPAKPEDFLKTHFPDLESVDQLKEQTTMAKTLKEENEKMKTELEKIKSSLKGFDVGVDPKYLRFQKLEKENPNLAKMYRNLIFSDEGEDGGFKGSEKILRYAMIMDDPDLADSPTVLKIKMREKYPILFEEDADPDSDEYTEGMELVKHDAKKAKQRIMSEFDKIDVPVAETPEAKKERVEKILKSWDGFDFKNKELTTVKVSLDGDSPEPFMDIEIPEGERTTYLKAAMQYMIDNGLEKSKDSVEQIQKYINGLWIGGNLAKYNRMVAENAKQMTEREWRKYLHNPKQIKQPDTSSKPSSKDDFISGLLSD